MFTYQVDSLEDIASAFDVRAKLEQDAYDRAIVVKHKNAHRVAASTWRTAAEILRSTKIKERE